MFNILLYQSLGAFRGTDGRLIVAGTEEGKLRVFDKNINKPLRFVGEDEKTKHTAAVRKCCFLGAQKFVSFSDDQTIKVWSVMTGQMELQFGSSEVNSDESKPSSILA